MKYFIFWNALIYGVGWFSGLIPFAFKGIAATWELGDSWAPLHWLAGFYVLLLLIPLGISIQALANNKRHSGK